MDQQVLTIDSVSSINAMLTLELLPLGDLQVSWRHSQAPAEAPKECRLNKQQVNQFYSNLKLNEPTDYQADLLGDAKTSGAAQRWSFKYWIGADRLSKAGELRHCLTAEIRFPNRHQCDEVMYLVFDQGGLDRLRNFLRLALHRPPATQFEQPLFGLDANF